MIKLQGKKVFLSALERDDCRKIWQETEFDFENPPDYFIVGASVEKADELYSDIQSKQGKTQIRLGIFLPSEGGATLIGDIALLDINWQDRLARLGMALRKLSTATKATLPMRR